MLIEDYNKIIESLLTKSVRADYYEVSAPATIRSFHDVHNTLILVAHGRVMAQYTHPAYPARWAQAGEMVFIPGRRNGVELIFGQEGGVSLSNEDYIQKKDPYFRSSSRLPVKPDNLTASFYVINFEVRAFDAIQFFTTLDIPPFVLQPHERIHYLIHLIYRERYSDLPGHNRMMHLHAEAIVVELVRHILQNQLFVEKLATNTGYFRDQRLIEMLEFIKDNIEGDLSNKVLAQIANVSEDYVGQYFKVQTGMNPQDYIEYQRMEKAIDLLRTSQKSIRVIGKEVGYKDTAYFCRRFKMMYGISAGRMRRRDSLIGLKPNTDPDDEE